MVIVTDLDEVFVHIDTGADLVPKACFRLFSGTAKCCVASQLYIVVLLQSTFEASIVAIWM
jgi:hypothetical protein